MSMLYYTILCCTIIYHTTMPSCTIKYYTILHYTIYTTLYFTLQIVNNILYLHSSQSNRIRLQNALHELVLQCMAAAVTSWRSMSPLLMKHRVTLRRAIATHQFQRIGAQSSWVRGVRARTRSQCASEEVTAQWVRKKEGRAVRGWQEEARVLLRASLEVTALPWTSI